MLKRVFDEQYKVVKDLQVELRPGEKLRSASVQSPHAPDSTYRHKGDQSRYQPEMTTEGLLVTDTRTGKLFRAKEVCKHKNSRDGTFKLRMADITLI